MWKKVPDPQNPGQYVDAVPVEIVDGQTEALLYAQLADGTRISLTVHIIDISRIEGRVDAQGQPFYNVNVNGQVKTVPPNQGGGTA